MKKWIQKRSLEINEKGLFKLKTAEYYHPQLDVTYDFSMVETNNWINVIPLTEDKKFIMVKQHRLGTDEITIETPGGVIEKDEEPEKTALRELMEETGYKPERIHFLKKLSANPAIMNNYIYFYFAENCRKIEGQNLDNIEDIEIELFDIDEILRMIESGKIDHSYVITALSLFFLSKHNNSKIKYI